MENVYVHMALTLITAIYTQFFVKTANAAQTSQIQSDLKDAKHVLLSTVKDVGQAVGAPVSAPAPAPTDPKV